MNPPPDNSLVPALAMRGVAVASVRDPQTVVCEGVDWTVLPGEFWAVAGMHGSGKSDLLALAAGLTAPAAGSYRLFGREMPLTREDSLPERLRVGLVFDGGGLLQHLSVRENVALPLLYHLALPEEETARRVTELLERTGLTAVADVTPGNLSRSRQKLAGLARALVLAPEVLLLDNPLGGLDLRQAAWWLGFLEKLAAAPRLPSGAGMTLVVTTEDLRPWRCRAGQFALLRDRRLIPLGGGGRLADHPEPLVKEFLAEHLSAV